MSDSNEISLNCSRITAVEVFTKGISRHRKSHVTSILRQVFVDKITNVEDFHHVIRSMHIKGSSNMNS